MSPGRFPGARLTTPPRIAFNEGQSPGIQFTERMTGWLGPAPAPRQFQCLPYQFQRCQYEKGAKQGRVAGRRLDVLLTVTGNDIEALLYEQEHPASFAGTARAWGLRGETPDLPEVLAVTGGKLELFTIDPQGVHSRRMNYGADVTTLDGRAWRLLGFKSIMGGGVPGFAGPGGRRNRLPMSAWQDLTRLFVSLHPLSGEQSFLGILTLSGRDFARQLLTIRGTGGDGAVERFDTAMRFFAFFGSVLRDAYGGSFARGRYAAPNWARGSQRSLRAWARLPQANTNPGLLRNDKVIVHAGDGSPMRLTRIWGKTQPGRLPIILAPGFGVRAMSYATDTVRPNLVESLCGEGYEVWLLDHRASPELAPTRPPFTVDQVARHDWPAAVKTVLDYTNVSQVNVLAHCLNGASFMMAALSGLLSGKIIRAAVVSQLATHPVTSTINEVRIMAGLGPILRLFGVKTLQVTVDVRGRLRPSVVGWMLKHYPTSDPCDNPICRRIRFIFGESYLHANLDRVTHDSIIEMFGTPDNDAPATMDLRALLHVTRMVSAGHLVDEEGRNVYLTQDAADRLDFPLALMGGECNALFLPAGLEEADAWLTQHHKRPKVIKIPNYGHMDCFIGARAHEDVFPKIIEWLQNPTTPSGP